MRLLFSFLILVSFLNASIVLNEGIDKIDDFQMLYYNDTTGSLGINNISKLDFNQTISNAFAFGYIKGKSWFKITLVNNTDKEDFLLHMNDAWLYELNLYSFEASKIEKIENGWKVAIKDKDILDTSPTFNIHIDKGKTKTFYIELDANLGTLGKFVIYLKKASHLKNQLLFIALYMFYFGAAFVVFILNFFLFLTLKERIYLYYSLYALVFSSYILSLEGMTEYIFPSSFLQLAFLSPLSSLLLILFSREILETSKLTPKIDKILIFFSVVMLSLTILVYISPLSWFHG